MNKSNPIDDVPLCVDRYKVLNENIVVKPLNNTAKGVLVKNILSRLPNSSNLLIK